jgi:hypothetical protein
VKRRPLYITGCLLFLGMWLLLSATSTGHVSISDEVCYFYMARNFLDHGKFDAPQGALAHVISHQQFSGGGYSTPYSFGHSFYLLPWVVVGRALQVLVNKPWTAVFAYSFAHSLTTSLAWTCFFFILLHYGLPARRALIFSLVSLVSTLAFPYARTLFAEPVLMLMFAIAWLCFLRPGAWMAVLGGLALAFAITVKPSAAVLLPGFLWLAWRQTETGRHPYWRLGLIALISSLGLVLFGLYNYDRFGGEIFTYGYGTFEGGEPVGFSSPVWFGLAVFLISPGKAIWLFSPLILLGVIGWKHTWVNHRTTAIFIAWSFVSYLVLHSAWCRPEGGVCWGPRFLVPVLPMMLLPAALFWNQNRSKNVRLAFTAFVTLGLFVQIIGTAVNHPSLLTFELVVPEFASKAVYCDSSSRYNLAFSPFSLQIEKLAEIASEGSLLGLRPEAVRTAADRSATHGFPYWCDGLDIWAIHLVKDGYSAARVLTIEGLLIASGVLLVLLAFQKSGDSDSLSSEG